MRLRSQHIALAIVIGVVGLFVFVLAVGLKEPDKSIEARATETDVDFLDQVRAIAERDPARGTETGAVAPAGLDKKPDIEVETTTYDIGVIPNDDIGKGQVMIYNRGDFDLEIMQVNTSCACTLGHVENTVIPPGGQEPLIVTVNPARIPGFDSHKVLTIMSNDPDEVYVQVDVLAQVKPEFTMEPRPVDFGEINKGDVVLAEVVVRQADEKLITLEDQPFAVTGVQSTAPGLSVSLRERPESEWEQPSMREYVVELLLDSNKVPPGPYHASYSIETNVSRVMHYRSEVNATVVAPYAVTPRPLSLGAVQPGQVDAGMLTVLGTGPIEISDVTTTAPDLQVSLRPVEGDRGAIAISVAPDAGLGFKRGDIRFTVKAGDRTFTESIPVTGSVVKNAAPAAEPDPEPDSSAAPVAQEG